MRTGSAVRPIGFGPAADVVRPRGPDDDGVLVHHNATSLRPPDGPRRDSGVAVVLPAAAALVGGTALGVGLGWWCRMFAASPSVNGALSDLGAPWIAAAFVAGAVGGSLVPRQADDRLVGRARPAAIVGAITGATCLVVATIVYYGPARTGSLDVSGAGSSTAVWTGIGVSVGVAFGAIGALWRTARGMSVRLACLVAFGTALTAEAYFLIDIGAAGNESVARHVLDAVAIAGLAAPLLLGFRWQAVAGIALVAVLAAPGSLAAELLSRLAVGSIWRLNTSA